MSAPGRRSLTDSVSKLSVGVQTDGTYMGRLSLLSPFGRDGRGSASEGEGVGLGEGEGCSQRDCAAWRARTPHLNPLPLAKGRGETNGMGLTTGEHYRSLDIALKSYCQPRWRRAILKIYYAIAMKSLNTSLFHSVIVVG